MAMCPLDVLNVQTHACPEVWTSTDRLGERMEPWKEEKRQAGSCNFPISPKYVKIKTSRSIPQQRGMLCTGCTQDLPSRQPAGTEVSW